MSRYVLDTSILSYVLRQDNQVVSQLLDSFAQGADVYLCPFVYYEAWRGLFHRNARQQARFLEIYTQALIYEDFGQADWQEAAETWAVLRGRGQQIHDADLLIGVYARRREAILVTDNTKDFALLNLPTENWRRPYPPLPLPPPPCPQMHHPAQNDKPNHSHQRPAHGIHAFGLELEVQIPCCAQHGRDKHHGRHPFLEMTHTHQSTFVLRMRYPPASTTTKD